MERGRECKLLLYFLASTSGGIAGEGTCPAGDGREREVSYSPRSRRSSVSNSARRDSAATRPARSSSARA